MTRRLRFILLSGLFVSGAASAARAESLDDAVLAALNHHPSVEAALANKDALDQDRAEAWSGYLPQVSLSTTAGRIYGDNSTSRGLSVTRGAGYSGLWEGNVSLTQTIFDGFQTPARVDAAAARRDSAGFDVIDVRENLALRTAMAYLDVLRGRESVKRLQDYSAKIDGYIEKIEKMVEEGATDAAVAEQARDVRAQLDNTLAGAQGQLRTALAAYEELTGHPPDDPMEKPAVPSDVIPEDRAEAITYAAANHPALRSLDMTDEALARDAKVEKGSLYPSVTGELSYTERDQRDLIGGESEDGRAVVHLNWDYAIGGAKLARIKKAAHRTAESAAHKADRERQLARIINIAYSDRQAAAEQVKIQSTRVKINEGLLKAHQAQFEAARVTLLQVLQTDNALFNADLALMSGEYKLLASQFAILASMGKLQDALKLVPASGNDG